MLLGKCVVKICNTFTGEHPCRSVISIDLLCNFTEITLRHGCPPIICCIFSEHLFLRSPLEGWSWYLLLQICTRLMINITEKFLDALFPLSAVSIVKIIDVNYWERCQLLKEYWERCKLFQNQCPRQWPSVAKLFSSHLRPRGTGA